MNVPDEHFDRAMADLKTRVGAAQDVDLSAEQLAELAQRFLDIYREHAGAPFPVDPYEQLELSIEAVFRSWMGKRAVDYRRQFRITKEMANGTAVNVCTMVFGNMGNDSATGVGFTRNPGTGENVIYGEYLVNAQGEDVVAGIRTPKPLAAMAQEMPELHRQLVELRNKLEAHYREVQDFEFTIERGRLYCLQTRNGKMNARAMVVTSVEMFDEGLITKEQALNAHQPDAARAAAGAAVESGARRAAACAGPAGVTGCGVRQHRVRRRHRRGARQARRQGRARARGDEARGHSRLLRRAGDPDQPRRQDLACRSGRARHGQAVRIGLRSHRDRRARNGSRRSATPFCTKATSSPSTARPATSIRGGFATVEAEFFGELSTLLSWADDVATLGVQANADTPRDAARARQYGAVGIGLCRTERMFNDAARLPIVQQMILAETTADRRAALDKLLPIQRADFKGIFKAMAGLPVTVRLLDPPMHEFLPTASQLEFEIDQLRHLQRTTQSIADLPETLRLLDPELPRDYVESLSKVQQSLAQYRDARRDDAALARRETMLRKVHALSEVNPMLGHRGVRLGLTYPEIYEMQIRAILEAAADCVEEGVDAHPEIMVPQVADPEELKRIRALVDTVAADIETRRRCEAALQVRDDGRGGAGVPHRRRTCR